ncbi:conserved hypothetical protein [Neospora caninum Liverpool]|uniref:Uncharacterized protein n=1 Tax=Neospora caninum (strain Liverpool) TaxID=572307 RepID=F0VHI9_NEOCL|nr:conserved hypothetical protein [Neospora caninum Liverpool]CBZ53183.1 conserved hypothetical protein [Neospora caninum Liverpool]|eukprot:XP_003883215.1 conserved hypothetical protein [Neospora caninum Liverpool]
MKQSPSPRQAYAGAHGPFFPDASNSSSERVRDTPCVGGYARSTGTCDSPTYFCDQRKASSSPWPPFLGSVAGVSRPLPHTRFSPAALLRASRKLQEAHLANQRGGDLCMSIGRLYFRVITQTLLPSSLLHHPYSRPEGPSFSVASSSACFTGVPRQNASHRSQTCAAPYTEGTVHHLDAQDKDPADLERFYLLPGSCDSGRPEGSRQLSYPPPAYPGMFLGNGFSRSRDGTFMQRCHFGGADGPYSSNGYQGTTGALGPAGFVGSDGGPESPLAPRQWVTGSISDWNLLHPVALLRIVKNASERRPFRAGVAGPWLGAGGSRRPDAAGRTTSLCVESLQLPEKSAASCPSGSGTGVTGQWGETSFLPSGPPSGAFSHFGASASSGAAPGGLTNEGRARAPGGPRPCIRVSETGGRGPGELSSGASCEGRAGSWSFLTGVERAGPMADAKTARRLDGDSSNGEGFLYGFSVSMGMYRADDDTGHDPDIVYVPDPEQIDEALLGLPTSKMGDATSRHTVASPCLQADSVESLQVNSAVYGAGGKDRSHCDSGVHTECERRPLRVCMQNKMPRQAKQFGRRETELGWPDASSEPTSSALVGAYPEPEEDSDKKGDSHVMDESRRGSSVAVSGSLTHEVGSNGEWEPVRQRPLGQEPRCTGGRASGLEETAFPSRIGNGNQVLSAPLGCQTNDSAPPSRPQSSTKETFRSLDQSSGPPLLELHITGEGHHSSAASSLAPEACRGSMTPTAREWHDETKTPPELQSAALSGRGTQPASLYPQPQEPFTRNGQISHAQLARSRVSPSSPVRGLTGKEREAPSSPYSLRSLPDASSSPCWPTDSRSDACLVDADRSHHVSARASGGNQALDMRECGRCPGKPCEEDFRVLPSPLFSFPPLPLSRKMPVFIPPALAAAISCRRLSFPTTVCLGARLTYQSRLGLPMPAALPLLPAENPARSTRGVTSNTPRTSKPLGYGQRPLAPRHFAPAPDLPCMLWAWTFPAAHAVPLRATGLLPQLQQRAAYLRHHHTIQASQCYPVKYEPGMCAANLGRSSSHNWEEQQTSSCLFAQPVSSGEVPAALGGETVPEGVEKLSGQRGGRTRSEADEGFSMERRRDEERRRRGGRATPNEEQKEYDCGRVGMEKDGNKDGVNTTHGGYENALSGERGANPAGGMPWEDECCGDLCNSSRGGRRFIHTEDEGSHLADTGNSSRRHSRDSHSRDGEGTEISLSQLSPCPPSSPRPFQASEVSGSSGQQHNGSDIDGCSPSKNVESAAASYSAFSSVSSPPGGTDTPLRSKNRKGKKKKHRQKKTELVSDDMSTPPRGSDPEPIIFQSAVHSVGNIDAETEDTRDVVRKRASSEERQGITAAEHLDEYSDCPESTATQPPSLFLGESSVCTPQESRKGRREPAIPLVSPGDDARDVFPSSANACCGKEVTITFSGSAAGERVRTADRNCTAGLITSVGPGAFSASENAQGTDKGKQEEAMRGSGGHGHGCGSKNLSQNNSSSVTPSECPAREDEGRHAYRSPNAHVSQMHRDPVCPSHERMMRATSHNRQHEAVFPGEHSPPNIPVPDLPEFNSDTLVQQRFLVHYAFLFDPGALDSDQHSIGR